ncbi:FkbM family methyltransferase [Flavobacteriales bacterium]|nr:FkbM family methyltransferase [Flavobacteriales bacterium]
MKQVLKKLMHSPFGFKLIKLLKLMYTPPIKYAKKLRFKGVFNVRTEKGNSFKLYNNAFLLETHIFWLGIDNYPWENKTREIWCDLSKKSNAIADIGANVGIFSVLAKVNNPNALVIAFEPQPNIFKILKKNNTINEFDIHCENNAISNISGSVPFFNHGPNTFSENNTTSGSLNKTWRPIDQNSIHVEAITLESYINTNNIKSIDLLKIDVETLEYEVLLGYGSFLLKHEPIIILEIQSKKIGSNIDSLLTIDLYLYYSIDESRGLVEVDVLGTGGDNNYLLCPKSKIHLINNLICEL